ncbi:TonB-dependent receptor [Gilvimarinus sp. SDUM040013]|uniref:TonB-dependent receptor n=1 Tax=Gilvimarinus gilvus TaxID=3058038 RepID=A0ABU4S6J4_9GAMM|nr:TonB-dependent receptor [Gilvimarinus sp. SDUM040013]MDO3384849.1 TonB-dependent receptor [Gilvimarinus sp. SDUM040013]MDX6851528.1 TonB-dependent receptor [Gilvimarinus sp. SDUM040013]
MSKYNKFNLPKAVAAVSAAMMTASTLAFAQAAQAQEEAMLEEVVVTGIRASLANALEEKRESTNLIEVIQSEDIGKLPDQNLAEVLENVPGVQITRTGGVGTGVQIRGTNANRTEINGVSTVGSGGGRSGIDFEDVSASIISAVEVTKASEAKTIEGSVGGTINLRTIRPLELKEMLGSVRIQGENSSLATDSTFTPRFSGTFGNNWETGVGDMGVVISASYSEQDVSNFRPRVDRDNLVASDSGYASAQSFDFLPIQFLNQQVESFEYETTNLVGSFEWALNDDLKIFADAILNDQAMQEESYRVQASGVSSMRQTSIPDQFETVDFGTLPGENGSQDLGSIQAALVGTIGIDLAHDDDDPNLRISSDTDSRDTDSKLFRLGTEWAAGRFSGKLEVARTESTTINPRINTTLNFINPNAPLDAGGSNDNAVPFSYDLRDGLAFGLAYGTANAPTVEDMYNPYNYVLRDYQVADDVAENSEDAFRADVTFDLDVAGITTIDFGYRYSKAKSKNDDSRNNVGLRTMDESPRGSMFSEILTEGPDNFGDGDGRDLFVADFLMVDSEQVASNYDYVMQTLIDATNEHQSQTGADKPLSEPTSSSSAFFDISEETNALYAQMNFEYGILRGNAGVRYIESEVNSTGISTVNGEDVLTSNTGSYDFFLPRINLVANVTEDIIIRAGYGTDIRRPDFTDLSTSASFSTSPNPPVTIGNPELRPEEVDSFDLTFEYYFAPSAVVSVGYFNKKRSDLHRAQQEDPAATPEGYRDTTAPCEGGGVYNPIADWNVFVPDGQQGVGICVPRETTINDAGETTQEGFEFAFQYDLGEFEDSLGWASGFGVLANYTIQEFSGGETVNDATSRASDVFEATTGATDVTFKQALLDLSENAYNITGYYEKYGLSARVRYTWREAYRSEDFGSTSSYPWGFPVVQDDRGQLNASVSYDVTDNLSFSVEGVNLTESKVEQYCVNGGSLLCYQGLTDRRVTVGASYQF